MSSSSSASEVDDDDDDDDLLYASKTFVTCRSPSDTFYLCQVLQNVYTYTKKIPIRWCSVIGEDGDDTKISISTRFKLSYTDTLDPNAILTDVTSVLRHDGGVISMKKQDIVESKRLLEKSIRGDAVSSDDLMDLTAEDPPVKKSTLRHIHFASSDKDSSSSASESSAVSIPQSKKRKMGSTKKKSRKRPPPKRARKALNTSVHKPCK